MSGLLLCTKSAETPYKVKESDISLYSMEELCYFIYNNIYMIGAEFFDDSLLEFIENGLGLSKTANRLKDEIYRNEPYTAMIRTVLDGSGYYSEDEKREAADMLKELDNKTPEERIKLRADSLAEKGRYNSALTVYRQLLKKCGKTTDIRMSGRIWNNMGVIYAKMFLYKEASECFEKACDTYDEQEFTDNLVCVNILAEAEDRLEAVKQKYDISEDMIDRYRAAVGMAKEEVVNDPGLREYMERLTYNPGNNLTDFYAKSDELINMWKKEYREQIQ